MDGPWTSVGPRIHQDFPETSSHGLSWRHLGRIGALLKPFWGVLGGNAKALCLGAILGPILPQDVTRLDQDFPWASADPRLPQGPMLPNIIGALLGPSWDHIKALWEPSWVR
jgi:hypothetical protein